MENIHNTCGNSRFYICFFIMIIKDCKEIIVVYLLQILLVIFCSLICSLVGYDINSFISNQLYYVMVIFYILLIVIFIKYNIYKDSHVSIDIIFICIYFVLSLSIIINMLFFLIGLQNDVSINVNLFLLIISSGILGPIVEEFLFRRILLNRLLLKYKSYIAIILCSFIFALFHMSLNGFIYAFILGLCLSYIYIKFRNIKLCILCHMISNIFVLFLFRFNLYILSLTILCFIISILIILKRKTIKL